MENVRVFWAHAQLLNMSITTSRDGARIISRSRKRGAEQGQPKTRSLRRAPLGPNSSVWGTQAGGKQRVTQNI